MGAPGGINHRERLLEEEVDRKKVAIRRLRLAMRGIMPLVSDAASVRYAEKVLDDTYGEAQ